MSNTDVYVAKEAFATILNGQQVMVPKGATVRAGHPLLKGREALFEPRPEVDFELDEKPVHRKAAPVVEQATAAPGEQRRGPGRPRRKSE